MYSADYNDRVANNFGLDQTLTTIQAGRLENWVNNVMTWGTSSATTDVSNTNVAWVTGGVLGKYLGSTASVYRTDVHLTSILAPPKWRPAGRAECEASR
jgi:hypothetical protein